MKWTFLTVLILLFFVSCGELGPNISNDEEINRQAKVIKLLLPQSLEAKELQPDPKDIPYAHPLSNTELNGRAPFYDIRKFDDGLAITVGDSVRG